MNEQEYIEQIIAETGYQPTKEQLDYLNAMSELSRQEILLELRNGFTSYGRMQPLPELLKSYGADEKFIKTAQKEIAQWYWSNLGKIAEENIKLTNFEMYFTNKFALDKLKELGLSDVEVNNAFMTDDFFKTGLAFTDPGMRTEFDKFLRENAGMSIFEAEEILNEVPDTIPDDMIIENIPDTPTNVVDEGVELYHSRAKGVDLPEPDKGLHAGTYNAALDKAAMQYNNINFYNWAFDAQEKIAIAHNNGIDIVADMIQGELEDLTEGNSVPIKHQEEVYIEWVTGQETEYIIYFEGEISLENGEYINDLKANLYTGDMNGFRGDLILELDTDYQYADVQKIANNPDIAKISKTDSKLLRPGIDTQYSTNSLDIAEDLLENIGTGYSFSGERGYDLYKVSIKPNAKILELPGEIVLQINGSDVTWTADELQNTLIDTDSSQVTEIENIKIGDKTIEIPNEARRKDVSKLLFGDYDVITYKNQGEDVGSTSYLFKDSNSYTIEKIDNVKFNDDVNKKFYGTNKYDYYSDKANEFKDQSTFKKYQVKEYNPNLTFTDTPTNVVDDIAQLENSLNEKYSDVLEFNYNVFGDDMASTKPLQIGLREDGVLGIDVISVSDNAQGQGYGSSIMNEIIEFADKNNLEIHLEPLEGQEDFFTKLGFEQFGDDEAEYRKLPTNVGDNIAQQVDVQDVRIYFNEAYNKFNEEYMPWNYFENFLINEKELSEDVAKGIIDDIKVGLTKPEFTNFPQSTFDPNLFPKAGTNFDSAVSRNMFNSTQVQRELSAKYILEDVEDYLNLSEEQSTKLANTFYEGINPRTTGTIEFYVQQQSPNKILAGDVKSGLDMTHQVPGFYTEPIGNRSLSAIRGVGSNAPINNYYKVQVNTDNLLVDIAPARFAGTQGPLVSEGDNVLGRQINKINWDTFTKETGITYEMLGPRAKIIDGQKYYTGSVMDLSRSLNTFQPNRNITGATSTLSKTNVWEALRKSGIEGFVTGPTNVQYEIVFLDPNDNLGIGKRMNIQDATVQEFQTNKAAVTQLDELVIQPKPVTELNTYNQEDLNKLGGGNQLVDESKVTQLDETTNAFKTQSNDIVQKLPIEKEVKDKIAKNIAELQVKWTTWSGPLELLDIYETGVMLFYGVVAAAPELKSYANTLMKDMYNTMIEFSGMENYGMKKLSGSDYEPNWSYIGEQIDKAEKIMPSEMLIKTIKEGAERAGEENLMTGFGYIPPSLDTRKKLQTTLTNPKTPEKEDTGPSTYDKIKDTIGEWWKKPIVVYDR